MREVKSSIFALALPALLLAGLGLALLGSVLRNVAGDETAALNQAALHCVRSLAKKAEIARSPRPVDLPPARHDRPEGGSLRPRHGDGGPGPHGGGKWHTPIIENLPQWCKEVSEAAEIAGFAFEIVDAEGVRLCASPRFPDSPSATCEVTLFPPFGRGVLRTARVDGFVSPARAKANRLLALGVCIVLLAAFSLSAFVGSLVRVVRREREASLRKTDFVDNVSHELRTPLAGIRLNAELLAEGRLADEAKRRGALDAILVESDRLSRMVSKLLDFSRLEKGTFRYEIETFDLADFAISSSEMQTVAAISGGRASVSAIGSGAMVSADKNAIRQICVNLTSNALKYSEGEIGIEVEGNEIRFMDRGPGIPPGDEERIFERFYRVDDSITRKTGGIGIGLSLARDLARGMGGDLSFRHRPGGGSVFILSLAAGKKTGSQSQGA